jgi:hypothetical protein
LNKLKKQGIVKEAKYELIEVEKEANSTEVKVHLDILKKENNSYVITNRLRQLSNLAGSQRIAHIPNVLRFCAEALIDQKYRDAKVLNELIRLVELMLGFERRSISPKQNLIDIIQNDMLPSIIQVSENVTDEEVLRRIIYCLKNTDRKESVDAIFNIVEKVNDDMYSNLKSSVFDVLFNLNSSLQKNWKTRIYERIDALLRSINPKTHERGIELSRGSR